MSKTKSFSLPPAPPKQYKVLNTSSTNNADLDFSSYLALQWATKWINQHGGLRSPQSGIIRRALSVYVNHLQKLDPAVVTYEVQRAHQACKGTFSSTEDREAAKSRLEAAGDHLPPFEVVLRGQYAVDETARFHKRLETLNHIPPKKVKPSHE
jgi:hypothetical protein